MSHDVFISYSSKDSEVAHSVLGYLEGNGLKCWIAPRNIVAGAHYASSILEAIKSAKLFIVIFSANSDSSEQVLKEVDRAVHAKLPIIPFRIESHMPSEAMEYYLCNTHWLNAYGVEIVEKYFNELLKSCRELLQSGRKEDHTIIKKTDEVLSDRLKNIVFKMQESAEKEAEEGALFYKKQIEEKEELSRIEKFEKEKQKKDLIQQQLKKSKVDEPLKEKTPVEEKEKLPLIQLIILIVFVGIGSFLYQEHKNKEKKFEIAKDKGEFQNTKLNLLNYKELSSLFYKHEDFIIYPLNDLALLAGTLESKGGELFQKVGHELIEKESNKFEIHNLVLIKKIYNELVAKKNNIKNQIKRVLINPVSEGLNSEIEKQWLIGVDIQSKAIDFYKVHFPLRKESPFVAEDFEIVKENTLVLTIQTMDSKTNDIFVSFSNEDIENKIKSIFIKSDFDIKIKNEKLKYKNEVKVLVSKILDNDKVSQLLVSVVYQLSKF